MATHIEATASIVLTAPAHQLAEQFCQRQTDVLKAEQVYLNTLAVYAVNDYLQNQGLETDWSASDSWDTVMQSFSDVGDLVIPSCGKLECRPVLPDATEMYVPIETWSDRLGFIAVQFDDVLETACLLGFISNVASETIALAQLQPLSQLLEVLNRSQAIAPITAPVHLSRWLQQAVDAGWQVVEDYFTPLFQTQAPAYSFRGEQSFSALEQAVPVIGCSKPLTLKTQFMQANVALVVGLLPISEAETEIWVQLKPISNQSYLPPDLQIRVLDAEGIERMQAQARNTEIIQLQFVGEPGEQFSLNIVLEQISVIETFVV
ncbi:MAG: hypothetical protein Kow00121_50520 [Elainellaceae cyanobacterium]